MRIFTVSDVHIDYAENRRWLLGLSDADYKNDLLILAGDLSDRMELLELCFSSLREKFSVVMFVPGNHELWVARDAFEHSLVKFEKVLSLCKDYGVLTDVFNKKDLSIVPLFSWYDFSFGEPSEKLMKAWSDFKCCQWPENYNPEKITEHFLGLNNERLFVNNKRVISFSHFVPSVELMPRYILPKFRYLYPALGSENLGQQIRMLKPDIHIYGHSHVNQQVHKWGTLFVNNAYGYPSETRIAEKRLLRLPE